VKSVCKFLLQTVTLAFLLAILLGSIDTISSADVDSAPRETPKIMDSETSRRAQTCCPIVELRQYTLHSGKRDTLIDLFDREFVESQEALGMKIIGQFRDLNNPDRFVWLRGFRDMPSRAEALKAFYGGPVWKAHGKAANATMIDSDNVLLLRPARPITGFALENTERPPRDAREIPKGLIVATIYYFDRSVDAGLVEMFERKMKPILTEAGALVLACFITEDSANTFPALPVREGKHVLVWFSRFQDEAAYESFAAALARSPRWRSVSEELAHWLKGAPEELKLSPTARSQLRG
jgi:NIPSNAP